RLLDVLASHAHSPMGAARCRSLLAVTELQTAQNKQQETVEMATLGETTDPFPTLSFPDIKESLARVAKGASVEAHELRDCSIVLEAAEQVHRYLGRHHQDGPALVQLLAPMADRADLLKLRRALDAAIDPDGSIKESATSELRRLTHHVQNLKQRMRHRLEQILHSQRYSEILQELYFAERQGRYVVPIKAEMQGRIPGIVHDVSASGATVFLEPRELVDLNNGIKVADLEIEREVRRILRELSALLAERADAIAATLDVLAEFDCIMAKAALGRQLRAQPVKLNGEGRILLKQARHPLLMLTKDQVVPNSIALDETVRALIISGPNTGGKTVALKIVGLCAFMVRAGLHFPCDAGSEMALFPEVYADIGDAQDLARDLSSFSAHMTQMIQLLHHAAHSALLAVEPASAPAKVLVLLDEPVTSTDPAEGAALAEALLVRLAGLGTKVIATTHYNALKVMAQSREGFANASVEFDIATLSPTYRLFLGMPGGSSAIDIAGRLGMDESILEEARRLLKKDDRALDSVLNELQETQRQLVAETDRMAKARLEAERAEREAKETFARLQTSEREERKGIKKKLTEEFLRARAEVQATLDAVKRERTVMKAKEAKQRLAVLEEQAREELTSQVQRVPIEQLQIGDPVEIVRLGTIGVLLESPQQKKRVRVKVGDGEMSIPVSGLVGLPSHEKADARPKQADRPLSTMTLPVAREDDQATVLDVRGKAADEALDVLVAGLDRAALVGAPFVRIIHGHGTGRLKSVLREYLKESPYVAAFRAGDRAEGGDGVTIAQLK
ncbi:MAG: endonuclease MutS2, partial [Nitrospiraceae bacterium]